jgi:hypothetical protein
MYIGKYTPPGPFLEINKQRGSTRDDESRDEGLALDITATIKGKANIHHSE